VTKQAAATQYMNVLRGFNQALNMNCTDDPTQFTQIVIPNFYYPAVQLSQLDTAQMLQLIPVVNSDGEVEISILDLVVSYSC